jgi:hypothetical protein
MEPLLASAVVYLNSSAIFCRVPFSDPPLPEGDFFIELTIDGSHYVTTGGLVTTLKSPGVSGVEPPRGCC